jgi:uncharacterized membrane-anchored protein YhcB (DUF1043 family)
MVLTILVGWGCMPKITPGCVDMTNASSTYLSIAIGAVVGAFISLWLYKIQKNTTTRQEETLRRINDIEESHDKVLKSIEQFQNHQERVLSEILRPGYLKYNPKGYEKLRTGNSKAVIEESMSQ